MSQQDVASVLCRAGGRREEVRRARNRAAARVVEDRRACQEVNRGSRQYATLRARTAGVQYRRARAPKSGDSVVRRFACGAATRGRGVAAKERWRRARAWQRKAVAGSRSMRGRRAVARLCQARVWVRA